MKRRYTDIICNNSRPLRPIATNEEPKLARIEGIRAVLSDIYGTMLVSGSNSQGINGQYGTPVIFEKALKETNVVFCGSSLVGFNALQLIIQRHHHLLRRLGVRHPEIRIEDVWRELLEAGHDSGARPPVLDDATICQLAVEYEVRANPVWPMPNLMDCLKSLHQAGYRLGVVSNAQFFTADIFPALTGFDMSEIGFSPPGCIMSYTYGRAKPDPYLFERAAEYLSGFGISPDETLYIGNDIAKDIKPAKGLGFHTALFAADARSLRKHCDDPRFAGLRPDLVLTDWSQLKECLDMEDLQKSKSKDILAGARAK